MRLGTVHHFASVILLVILLLSLTECKTSVGFIQLGTQSYMTSTLVGISLLPKSCTSACIQLRLSRTVSVAISLPLSQLFSIKLKIRQPHLQQVTQPLLQVEHEIQLCPLQSRGYYPRQPRRHKPQKRQRIVQYCAVKV